MITHGDCLSVMPTLEAESFDACVTDPPYGLEFMGKEWDKLGATKERNQDTPGWRSGHGGRGAPSKNNGVPFGGGGNRIRYGSSASSMQEWHYRWATEVLRLLKPGAYMLAFGGTRTHHRLMCAIEDAGFEVRDTIMWVYGSGFPKSLDVSKAIDKAAGCVRPRVPGGQGGTNTILGSRKSGEAISGEAIRWSGWGTALKPAWEPIIVARKPLIGTVAENVQRFGTGALNIEECRVAGESTLRNQNDGPTWSGKFNGGRRMNGSPSGRWPANLLHDGSEEVVGMFPQTHAPGSNGHKAACKNQVYGVGWGDVPQAPSYSDSGSAARFFYCAKASRRERGEGNNHPTVKPLALMRYLCRLVTPPGGLILDPFAGSGSTGKAAIEEGFRFHGIEREAEYCAIAEKRCGNLQPSLFAGAAS